MKVERIDELVRQLDNRWTFVETASGGTTDATFFMSWELNSFVLQMLVGGLFDTAFRRCVSAFEARAREVYGHDRRSAPVPETAG